MMDSREQPQPQSQPPNMLVGPTSYPSMMAPATARFPFNNNNIGTCEALKPCRLASESAKKKRGRPRKYSPDGNIALGLASSSSTEPLPKKNRGRPPGSGKKQMDSLGVPFHPLLFFSHFIFSFFLLSSGTAGTAFTPHVILADTGEDIVAKIMAFCQQSPRTVCILSANGAIRNVTLQQAAVSGGTITYEGQFEIISLSGSMLPSESSSGRNRMGGLSVSLAGSDGRVLGGGVAGVLTAASPVQVIVGSFIADSKKSSSNYLKFGPSSTPSSQMLTFGAPLTPTSPTSQGPSTESSDDNENTPFSKGSGLYNNANRPIHNMPIYHHQLWAGQTQQ